MNTSKMKLCFMRGVLILLTVIICASLVAEKPRQWETATVVSQNLDSREAGAYSGPIGAGRVTTPINVRSNIVVVDTGAYRYTWLEFTRSPNWHHFIVLTVHDDVRFYRDGESFVVLDAEGKKHKFTLVGAEKK